MLACPPLCACVRSQTAFALSLPVKAHSGHFSTCLIGTRCSHARHTSLPWQRPSAQTTERRRSPGETRPAARAARVAPAALRLVRSQVQSALRRVCLCAAFPTLPYSSCRGRSRVLVAPPAPHREPPRGNASAFAKRGEGSIRCEGDASSHAICASSYGYTQSSAPPSVRAVHPLRSAGSAGSHRVAICACERRARSAVHARP
jgi:hypothetical protein